MSIEGALIGGALGAYGKKPKVPDLKPIDVNAVQKATTLGNIANFGDISKLATGVNTFNQDQLDMLIDRVLGAGARQQIQSNLASQLRGEIPQDVRNAIYRGNAERGAAGNAFGGGGFSRNVDARSLGLTSLDITNKALSSAESWLSQASAPQFNVTSMFFSPQQRLAFEQNQQAAQYQHDLTAASVAAAPDPATAALGQSIDAAFNSAQTIGGLLGGAASYYGMSGGFGSGAGAASAGPNAASYAADYGGEMAAGGGGAAAASKGSY
jgi:hypothetical protein